MKKLLCLPFLLLLLVACQPITQHPEIERPLVFTETYLDLYQQYQIIYAHSTEDKQRQMRQNIAPLLNDVRHLIAGYNDLVLMGADPGSERRQAITAMLREISHRLLEVEDG